MIKLSFGHTGLFRCVMSGRGDYMGRNPGCSSTKKPAYIRTYSEISGFPVSPEKWLNHEEF